MESEPINTELLFTFPGTNQAIQGEQLLTDGGLAVRVMPLPSAIRAGCGLCLRISHSDLGTAKALFRDFGGTWEQIYERTVTDGKSQYRLIP